MNADACLWAEEAGFFGVADATGDEPRSAEVARIALEMAGESIRAPASAERGLERAVHEAGVQIREGLERANRRLCAENDTRRTRIGTTFAGVVIRSTAVVVAKLGDSRVHRLSRRRHRLVRLGEDDTVCSDAAWRGVPPDIADALPNAQVLTRALGLRPELRIEPFVERWERGDTLLLCSDGLTEHVGMREIERVLLAVEDLGAAAHRLIQSVLEVGGRDDVTLVLVRWSAE